MKVSSIKKTVLLSSISGFLCQNAFSSVSIASWWGYIGNETILKVQNKCKTTIYLDEYYTNDEFIHKYSNANYDVAIFSGAVYNLLSNKIENNGINFNDIREKYNSSILSSFNNQNFSKNTGIFALSLTGILYNTNKININNNAENIYSIFSLAKGKKISIIDDPIESIKLLSFEKNIQNVDDGVKEFNRLSEGTTTFISNDIDNLVKDDNFALAYLWSGEAYKKMVLNKDLKFIVNPNLSYVTLDLIAALNKNIETECVAKELARKETLEPILEKEFYFSPYEVSNYFNFEKLKWIDVPSIDEYIEKSNLWKKIKYNVEK